MEFIDYIYLVNLIVVILSFIFVLRYNLHMFQLNGYKNKVHLRWLKINRQKQAILVIFLVSAVLAAVARIFALALLMLIGSFIVLLYYYILSKAKAKKKLVYTNRVKRLIATNLILAVILTGLIFPATTLTDFTFIRKAVLGATLVNLIEPLLVILSNILNKPIEKSINNYYINDAKKILKQCPNLLVIGITGSYGKTSVKHFLSALLQAKYNVLMTPESYNTPMGVVKTIRSGLKPVYDIFVCEMGARNIGDIKEICDIVSPTHGIITSIGPQHLESFKTIDNIIKTKFELADALPKEGLIFLNGDNEYIKNKEGLNHPIYYGIDNPNVDYRAVDITVSLKGTEFTVISPKKEEVRFQTKLLGRHNVVNIVGAIAVSNTLGIPLEDLIIPVRRLQPVQHRLQLIEKGSNITIIDDAFNSNPAGSKAALDTLALFDGLRILITPGMVELGDKE
ncbi:MAG TPA: UDP-N-acetylmuramoyl-tripeptide--D-alanyl-D-alanine ligase, partial [Mobilitalea sp.]|nr:UDP-N-acetylmuramoyl-tripeptide--D-alanyl-D-alanine ligase [Mobilitalea sp.]